MNEFQDLMNRIMSEGLAKIEALSDKEIERITSGT
jgi:hypothetical protein